VQRLTTEEIEVGRKKLLSRNKREYDHLLAEAIKIGKRHQTRAKHYVPKMYEILVKEEGFTPVDAAIRIYKDLAGIWEKDTIRRLLPPEAKNQAARERQALSRQSLRESNAGLILRTPYDIVKLEKENANLRKEVEELNNRKRLYLEKILKLERIIATLQQPKQEKEKTDVKRRIVLPPHLFMKAFTLMRGCSRPLIFAIVGDEVTDIDKSIE